MIKYKRQSIILNELQNKGSVNLKQLIKLTNKPKLTIQRDLVELEKQGKLYRVHGGAIPFNSNFIVAPKKIRAKKNIDIKRKLALKAASFISDNDTICFDSSTTCSFIAEYIPDFNINVVTPLIDTFISLTKKINIVPILTGGTLNKRTDTLIGNIAIETIKKFSFSKCFLSAEGFDPDKGSLDFDYEDNAIKNTIISVSEKIFLLIDSSKIFNTKGIVTCPVNKIYRIIIDKNYNYKWSKEIRTKIILV